MPRSSLSGLSDRELLARMKALVEKERATTLEILVHLNEVERRRLHLKLGYPSLFEYGTRHLGYSSSAAGRRIHAARCVRDFPEVYGLLEKNEVTLSSVSLVASILTEANKEDLLSSIRHKSQKDVEAIVADYRPPLSFRDRARPVCVAVPQSSLEVSVGVRTYAPDHSRSGSEISPSPQRPAPTAGQPAAPASPTPPRTERRLLVQFLASEAFMKKFEEARALLSNKTGGTSYEAVLEMALDEFLARRSHESKKQRRDRRKHARPFRKGTTKRVAPSEARDDRAPSGVNCSEEPRTGSRQSIERRGPLGAACDPALKERTRATAP